MSQELTLKVVVIGDSDVGKTCVSLRFLTGEFSSQTTPTIAAGFCNTKVKVRKTSINLLIWDTAGQEAYQSLTAQYYRETKIALILFDLTSPQSLESVRNWHERIMEANEGRVVCVLVGNKSDLHLARKISQEQGEKFAESIGAIYRETSALTGKGISQVFEDACEVFLDSNPHSSRVLMKKSVDVEKPDAPPGSCNC